VLFTELYFGKAVCQLLTQVYFGKAVCELFTDAKPEIYIPHYIINCRVLKENYYITIISQLKENYYIIINAEFHVPTGPVYLQKVLHRCHRETKCAP
jgi:hypothetical protein